MILPMRNAEKVLALICLCLVPPGVAAEEKQVSVHDLLQIRVEEGKPVLRTTLAATPPEELLTLNVRGFGEGSELTHTPGEKPGMPPRFYKLNLRRDDVPGQRANWQVTWTRDALDVQRSTHFTGEFRYTRLVRLLASPRNDVQLLVNEAGSVRGRGRLSVSVREKDFPGLLRKYPEQANEFLRPLMRELGQ